MAKPKWWGKSKNRTAVVKSVHRQVQKAGGKLWHGWHPPSTWRDYREAKSAGMLPGTRQHARAQKQKQNPKRGELTAKEKFLASAPYGTKYPGSKAKPSANRTWSWQGIGRDELVNKQLTRRAKKELTGRADAVRRAWAERKRRYGASGRKKGTKR